MAMPARELKESVPEAPETPEKVRVQFDFSKEHLDELDKIKTALHASTRAEVIRRALNLFTKVLKAEQEGAEIYIQKADGRLVQLVTL
jgi:hypothetical protein